MLRLAPHSLLPARGRPSVALEEVASCDLCGHRGFRAIRRWKDQLLFGPEEWTLVECAGCSLAFVNPRPTRAAIGSFYPHDYAAHTAPPTVPSRWHRRVAERGARRVPWWERRWLQLRQDASWYRIPSWIGEGAVLDLGCGSGGRYLDVLRALGWTTHGVEPNAAAVAAAVAKGHRALVGGAEEQHFPDESMDLVTIWHVLEHTHSPRQALEACFRTLKPGGQLSLCVPNWAGVQARVLGRYWWSCDAPRHLFQFTRPLLRRYLEEAGFRVLDVTTRTGPTSVQRAARHMLNAALGTTWTRDSKLASNVIEIGTVMLSTVRFLGAGSELRVIAERPA